MDVLKFGGTSLSSKTSLRNVLKILSEYEHDHEPVVVVVSALGGVTNNLSLLAQLVLKQDTGYLKVFNEIKEFHLQIIASIFSVSNQIVVKATFEPLVTNLQGFLKSLFQKRLQSKADKDEILSYGELFSGTIIRLFLNANGLDFGFLDSRKVIVTDNNYGNASLEWSLTKKRISNFFDKNNGSYVVTGYIGATFDGHTTTLGRGGSDFTATIFATTLKARSITKWTDVNGIMTADPNDVSTARSLDTVTFNELLNLSKFGTNVLVHPNAIYHLSNKNIPLLIRNVRDFKFPGTRIVGHSILEKRTFSIKNSCKILAFNGIHNFPKKLLKAILLNDHFFFRQKSKAFNSNKELFYIVSEECLAFIGSEINKSKWDIPKLDNSTDFEIVYDNISLVTITCQHMDKTSELEKIETLINSKGIRLLASRLFNCSICLIFKSKDSRIALNFLHEALSSKERVFGLP